MEALRQAASVAGVIALLLIGLWWLRRKGLATSAWSPALKRERQLTSIENLRLTPSLTLHLIGVRDVELLIAASPSGCVVIDPKTGQIAENSPRSAA